MTNVAVGRQWMSCGQSVGFARVIRPRQTTRLQGVHADALPVRTTTLVYAGKHRLYPQSTALITINRSIHHISASLIAPFYTDKLRVKVTS